MLEQVYTGHPGSVARAHARCVSVRFVDRAIIRLLMSSLVSSAEV